MATRKKKKAAAKKKSTARNGANVVFNTNAKSADRARAAARMVAPVLEDKASFDKMLKLLKDSDEPSSVRLAVLATLQAASFSVMKFQQCRASYLSALRSVSADPDLELRQRVLGMLAREKDQATQKRLLDGLRDKKKELVSPEKALQLLSYDVHDGAYEAAREIAKAPPDDSTRLQALRVLAADAGSTKMFEKLLRDRTESAEVRQLSAAALHTLNPKSLQTHARAIVLDDADDEQLKSVSLTALTQFGKEDDLLGDDDLRTGITRLEKKAKSAGAKQSAAQYLSKYSAEK